MDKNIILSKLNKEFPTLKFETHRFGRSEVDSVWVESQNLLKVIEFLKFEPELNMEFLENLNVSEIDQVLVLSYFLTSSYVFSEVPFSKSIVLRTSLVLPDGESMVSGFSVSHILTNADVFEDEVGELFGIRFESKLNKDLKIKRNLLPKGLRGFPLRKSYKMGSVVVDPQIKKSKSEAGQ